VFYLIKKISHWAIVLAKLGYAISGYIHIKREKERESGFIG
jgi:hypothetical protein